MWMCDAYRLQTALALCPVSESTSAKTLLVPESFRLIKYLEPAKKKKVAANPPENSENLNHKSSQSLTLCGVCSLWWILTKYWRRPCLRTYSNDLQQPGFVEVHGYLSKKCHRQSWKNLRFVVVGCGCLVAVSIAVALVSGGFVVVGDIWYLYLLLIILVTIIYYLLRICSYVSCFYPYALS